MDLENRVTRLEDIEAIKQLKARYCEICDDDHNPDLITTIFTQDGVWEGDGIGRAEGHAEIKALFEGFQKSIKFSQHMVKNPIIDVDGDTATARWYFFGTFKFYKRIRPAGNPRATMRPTRKPKINGASSISRLHHR